jgi:hypothetical protein
MKWIIPFISIGNNTYYIIVIIIIIISAKVAPEDLFRLYRNPHKSSSSLLIITLGRSASQHPMDLQVTAYPNALHGFIYERRFHAIPSADL